MISVVMIDSRSDKHPDWVQVAVQSIERQNVEVELVVVNNIGRKRTIGECFNLGVEDATGEYCFFIGDDDAPIELPPRCFSAAGDGQSPLAGVGSRRC